MSSIKVLPPDIAQRIAAGEVVQRPASVVKELIENSIDAGAREIRIEIKGGGREQICILDDGHGIPAEQVEVAFARHSTSKLTSVADLDHIQTLGFRGEALASIAAVSRLTLVTRARDETVGTALRLEGGQIVDRQPTGRPAGTAVTVNDLFYNVPARRKFLRTPRTERRHIDALTTRYAMAYPGLRFTLSHDGRITFQSTGSGDLQDVLVSVHGASAASQMLPVDASGDDQSDVQVSGYVSAPSLHRSNRTQITLFVNGRWVQDQSLTYAVTQAYHTLLMKGRYPIATLNVALPPQQVDVNVHPAKTEVRFHDGDQVFRAVQRAVRRTLVDQPPAPEAHTPSTWPGAWPTPQSATRRERLARLQPVGSSSRVEQIEISALTPSPIRAQDRPEPTSEQSDSQVPFLRVLGQMGLTYIVAEGPDGMYLIDQHAAHERVMYEKFMADKAAAQIASQALLEPTPVELTVEGMGLVEGNLEAIAALGFDLEPFGPNTVLVRRVPAMLAEDNLQKLLEEIVADLEVDQEPLASELEARLVRRVCKRAAIKAGQVLSQREMEEVIRQLEACASPQTCPHGRPTMILMSANQLAREFERR